MMLTASQAAAHLGISARSVYDLAAPNGPIPCMRIGRRVVFDEADILEYKRSCLCTVINNVVRSSLSSTAVLPVQAVSGLESAFRKLGIKPRLTHSTGRNRRDSTHKQRELYT